MYVRKVMSRELVSFCSDHSCQACCLVDTAETGMIMLQHYKKLLACTLLICSCCVSWGSSLHPSSCPWLYKQLALVLMAQHAGAGCSRC
jgi:hypothetical protein